MEQQVEESGLSRYNVVVVWISRVMAAVAAIVLGAMMLIGVADVCGRFFFNKPIEGSFELGGILLVTAGTWGMAYCQLQKSNIRIDVLTGRFPKRIQPFFNIFAYLFCVTAAGVTAWRSSLMTHEYMIATLGNLTSTLRIPYWPFMLTMAMGFAWLSVVFAYELFKSVKEVFGR
ncbi:MAG: TRAP transporter small permease [Dehalococcoidales bacterium]|nr:TRAP transporter small permease [Dehalococcoidales bacterium]